MYVALSIFYFSYILHFLHLLFLSISLSQSRNSRRIDQTCWEWVLLLNGNTVDHEWLWSGVDSREGKWRSCLLMTNSCGKTTVNRPRLHPVGLISVTILIFRTLTTQSQMFSWYQFDIPMLMRRYLLFSIIQILNFNSAKDWLRCVYDRNRQIHLIMPHPANRSSWIQRQRRLVRNRAIT